MGSEAEVENIGEITFISQTPEEPASIIKRGHSNLDDSPPPPSPHPPSPDDDDDDDNWIIG